MILIEKIFNRNNLLVLMTLSVVIAIEISRAQQLPFPIPFLILYAAVSLAASFGGLTVGMASGAIAAVYVIYCNLTGYGPPSLTGGPIQVLTGMLLYFLSGVIIGSNVEGRLKKQGKELTEKRVLLAAAIRNQTDFQFSETRFRDFAGVSSDWLWEMDETLKFTWFSDGINDQDSAISEFAIGKTRRDFKGITSSPVEWAEHLAAIDRHEPYRNFRYRTEQFGGQRWFQISGQPIFDSAGAFRGYRGTSSDVTDQIRIEQSGKDAREMLFLAIEGLNEAFVLWGPDDRMIVYNVMFRRINLPNKARCEPNISYADFVRPMIEHQNPNYTAAQVENEVQAQIKRHQNPSGSVERVLRDGRTLLINEQKLPNGCIVSVVLDITKQRNLERQVSRKQRLEAIGQLTTGIAHDFNNLLSVIQGNAELLVEINGLDDESITAILNASEKGAVLTRQLLAFSGKQTLKPVAVNLNGLAESVIRLLSRTIGEAHEIKQDISADLWAAFVDGAQLENAIVNLVLNARDSLPKGGEIIIQGKNAHFAESTMIEATEIPAGDYVAIAIKDHGAGMTEQVRAHAFEPFFTTKGVGRGSGMGLAMVHGFVQQSGGYTTLTTEVGRGTTVTIYLPRSVDAVVAVPAATRIGPSALNARKILIIEDNSAVLTVTQKMVKGLGYEFVSAIDAAEARQAIQADETIELVLSDVILPGGMSGPEICEEILQDRPHIKIIYMSGYPADAEGRNELSTSTHILLNKPFRMTDLATALQDAFED